MKTKLLYIIIASLISSAIGILPFIISILYESISNENTNLSYALIESLKIYLAMEFNAFIVVVILGAPVYFIFSKFNLANYITATFIGGACTLLIGSYQSPWLYIAISGFIIGPIFHYIYTYQVLKYEKI